MIGKLVRDGKDLATMDDGGTWQSDNASLASLLNSAYSPRLPRYAGPGAGTFGWLAIHAAADAMGAQAVTEGTPDEVPPRPAP